MLDSTPITFISSPAPASSVASSSAPSPVSSVPAFLRPMSAVPVAEMPPLKPLPTNDPYSPVATGQALFCAVFNVTFSTLLAWLASVPQHLIAQVRQSFASPSPSPSQSQSSENPQSKGEGPVGLRDRIPQSLSERILLACRSLFSLLRVYHTFSSYWDRVTPRQLGLLSRASQAIKSFSGRSFDFSYWADLGGPRPRSYSFASSAAPSSSVAPSPDLSLAPSSPSQISNFKSQIPAAPFPEWPFTALTAYKASFTMAPGRLLAQVCHDLARLTQSPSPAPSEFESLSPSPSPSPSQSAVALSSQSQSSSPSQSSPSPVSTMSTMSTVSTMSIPSTPSVPSVPATPSSPTLDIGHLTLDNVHLTLDNPHSPHPPP